MRVAFLIQCYKSPEQVNLLLNVLDHPDVEFFVHVDKKSNIKNDLISRENIHILPDDLRVTVTWGTFTISQAAIHLLKYAYDFGPFDYYCHLSNQCFPVYSPQKILDYLSENNGSNFLYVCESKHNGLGKSGTFDKRAEVFYPDFLMLNRPLSKYLRAAYKVFTGGFCHTFRIFMRKFAKENKLYFGSAWWCMHTDFIRYFLEQIDQEPQKLNFFKNVIIADEAFIHTFFMNSPYRDTRKEDLHYIDWSHGGCNPKILESDDLPKILNSGKLFARKLESGSELLELLSKHISET